MFPFVSEEYEKNFENHWFRVTSINHKSSTKRVFEQEHAGYAQITLIFHNVVIFWSTLMIAFSIRKNGHTPRGK